MRRVEISDVVQNRLYELNIYLIEQFHMSREGAHGRVVRIIDYLSKLGGPLTTARCRFREWREAGYHCSTFEGWVFAYEVFDEGIIIRDMAHGKMLDDISQKK